MTSDLLSRKVSTQTQENESVMDALYERNENHRLLKEMYWTSKRQRWVYTRLRSRSSDRYDMFCSAGVKWPPPSADIDPLKVFYPNQTLADARQYEDRLEYMVSSLSNIDPSSRDLALNPGRLYEPLNSGTQVRLLELNPGSLNEPLTFYFHIISLSSCHPEYEAVSYVWGRHDISGRVQDRSSQTATSGCNSVNMSKNLAVLLRHLRYKDRSRMIWVDGICINQHDKEERNHQVSLMGAVYSQARNVIVWLRDLTANRFYVGLESSTWYEQTNYGHENGKGPQGGQKLRGQLLFETICIIVNTWLTEHNLEPSAKYIVHSRYSEPQEFRQPQLQPEVVRECLANQYSRIVSQGREWYLWRALKDLYELPWFRRIWAVQELVLAPCALAKFGSAEIDWRWIGLSAAILRSNDLDKIRYHSLGGVYNAYLLYRLSKMSDLPPLRLTSLQLMRLTRGLQSTEVHDQVYGLLGISTVDNDPSTVSLLIQPDYDIPYTVLWHKLACKFIKLTNDLSILSSVHHARIENRSDGKLPLRNLLDDNIPSWVPQWDKVARASLLPWDSEENFCASYDIPMALKQPSESGHLVIQGLRIGQVVSICGSVHHLMRCQYLAEYFETEQGTKTLYQTLCAERSPYGSLIPQVPSDYMDSLHPILYKHTFKIERLIPGSFWHTYASTRTYDRSDRRDPSHDSYHEEKDDQPAKYEALVAQLGTNRHLCLTSNGYLALAPDVAQEGDILYVLAGSSVPVLLRPLAAINCWGSPVEISKVMNLESSCNHFVLVGDCYAQGLMYGEALSTLQKNCFNQGPVPFDLVSKHVLANATEELDPDIVPWVEECFPRHHEVCKTDAEFIDSLLSRHEVNERRYPRTQYNMEIYRAVIHCEQQMEPILDWVEIV